MSRITIIEIANVNIEYVIVLRDDEIVMQGDPTICEPDTMSIDDYVEGAIAFSYGHRLIEVEDQSVIDHLMPNEEVNEQNIHEFLKDYPFDVEELKQARGEHAVKIAELDMMIGD